MRTFAAHGHFRVTSNSDMAREGYVGGYGWFFGRFGSWEEFQQELTKHLADALKHDFVEFEKVIEVDDELDLREGEQRELYADLVHFPIQYRTLHMYRHDDA
jgi:hypothetical protein